METHRVIKCPIYKTAASNKIKSKVCSYLLLDISHQFTNKNIFKPHFKNARKITMKKTAHNIFDSGSRKN